MKDHLGNVRLTFTTQQVTVSETATLETANATTEQSQFLRYNNAKRVNSIIFDKTNGATTGYAERLNGSANEKYGLAKSISVMPGDIINAEVYAKYVDANTANWTTALTTLMGQIASNTAGVVVDGSSYASSTSSFPFPTQAANNTSGSSESGPKAYLNWLVFDRDYNLILGKCGYDRISTAPKESGQDVAHERLFSPAITIDQPGYVYIYLSNEEATPVDVFFDQLKVDITKSPVVQQDDYYPFGLTFNSYSRENSVKQDYLFNGKELQDELGLNWEDYGARMYDPAIARWMAIDPLCEKYNSHSPFHFSGNNPVRFVDVNGMNYDEYQFDADGKYKGKIEKEGEHYGTIEGKNGGEKTTFKFADPENDPKSIESGEITNVVKVEDKAIANVLEESGVNDKENQDSKYTYIKTESDASNLEGQGKMDYVVTAQIEVNGQKQPISGNTLYVTTTETGNVAHNNYNFGNFLWGAGAASLGISESIAKLGAHYNNFVNDHKHKGSLDSKDDQFSISEGYKWKNKK